MYIWHAFTVRAADRWIFKEYCREVLQKEKTYEENNSWGSDTACGAYCRNRSLRPDKLPQTARAYC